MRQRAVKKMHSDSGLVRAAWILIILIGILLVLIVWPYWKQFRWESSCIGCSQALATAKDFLTIDYLSENDSPTADDARKVVTGVMDAWEDLCPNGGTVYLVRTDSGTPPYTLVCGLHDSDAKRRTRLNADNVYTQVQKALEKDDTLTQVKVSLNGKTYTALRVDEPLAIYRGTDKTDGVKGTVIRYGIAGQGAWSDESAGDDTLCYFLFADEEHCACYQEKEGWTGDCLENAAG